MYKGSEIIETRIFERFNDTVSPPITPPIKLMASVPINRLVISTDVAP